MKLTINNGVLHVDNLFFCYCEAGNGRFDLPDGTYKVTTTYSHHFGQDLPNAVGIGWIGADKECDLVLGRVRTGTGVLPCPGHVSRLLALLEADEDRGASATLVIEHG